MGALYWVRVLPWRDRKGQMRGGRLLRASLVAVLHKGKYHHPDLIRKFYGANAPKQVFGPIKVDRLVFEYGPKDYIIVPDTPRNRGNFGRIES